MSKVVFPVPPPTTNALNARQKARLMRSTKKLERVLGATPHLVDDNDDDFMGPLGPLYLDFPSHDSSDSESSLPPSRVTSPAPLKRSPSVSSNRLSTTSDDSWTDKIPLIRVSRSYSRASGMPTRPGSPQSFASESVSSVSESTHERPVSIISEWPSFTIPSSASMRLEKMDRLRRKLGDGVPIDLVFPSSPRDSEMKESPKPAAEFSSPSPTPSLTPSRRKTRSPRDSISYPSPHHAPHVPKIKRKPVPQLIVTPIPPPPPIPSLPEKEKYRLSLIMESPDEDKRNSAQVETMEGWLSVQRGIAL